MTLLLPFAGAAFGAIAGSFIATLCLRWPRGQQAVSGRSHCDSCGRNLGAAELVPIASALVLRGRCRGCSAPIAPFHLQVEVLAAALAAAALTLQPNVHGLALALFWLLLLPLAILDARHYWLPDRLTLIIAAAGLLVGGQLAGTPLMTRLIGGLAGFASLALIAAAYSRWRGREGLGQGDAKLLGALGLWTGWTALPAILLIASVGGIALAVAQGRGRLDRLPFGTLLCAAAILWTAITSAAV